MNEEIQQIAKQYRIDVTTLSSIPKGFFRMSYIVHTSTKQKYFLKRIDFLQHIVEKSSFLAKIEHLAALSQDLRFIPKFVKTKDGSNHFIFKNKCYILQKFLQEIEGKVGPEDLFPLLDTLHNHSIIEDKLITEKFNEYETKSRFESTKKFIIKENDVLGFLDKDYEKLLETRFERYKELQKYVNKHNLCYVHKDPLSNTIRTKDMIYIIDWDDLTISNKEADLWSLADQTQQIRLYENISKTKVDMDACEYYALESFFLYYGAYVNRFYSSVSLKVKQEVMEGIKSGIVGWFESVYGAFN